jgi:hypothetical protein
MDRRAVAQPNALFPIPLNGRFERTAGMNTWFISRGVPIFSSVSRLPAAHRYP